MYRIAQDEISALTELYSTVFPSEAVRVLVCPPSQSTFQAARELEGEVAAGALQAEGWIPVDIGNDQHAQHAQRYFAVMLERGLVAPRAPLARRKIKEGLRSFLIRKSPVFYESLKYILLSLDDLRHRLTQSPSSATPAASSRTFESPITTLPRARMLIMLQWFDVGGAEAFAAHAIRRAVGKGMDVWIVSKEAARVFYRKSLEGVRNYFELDRQLPRSYHQQFIENLCKRHAIEILHNHHNQEVYAWLPALRKAAPGLIIADSLHIEERARYRRGMPGLSITWSPWINYHHVVSDELAKTLLHAGVPREKIFIGRLGGNIEMSPEFRLIKSLSLKQLNICFVGRMTLQKRPLLATEMLLRAVRLGQMRGVRVTANIVGEGFYRLQSEQIVARHGLKNEIAFHPSHADVSRVLRAADILLISSDNEGLTLVGCEAFNAGCLTVSCDVGAQREIVPSQLLLPRAPWRAVRAWESLLCEIFDDESFAARAVENTRQKMVAFSTKSSADEVLDQIWGAADRSAHTQREE